MTVDTLPARPLVAADQADTGFTVADLCRRWRVGPDKVRGFFRRGELVGVNLAANASARPQWRVTPEAVEAFERRRTSAPTLKPARRRCRAAQAVDYFA
jgi:hypothetical protein